MIGMVVKIYDNKIAAPVKHGTRFLDKIFNTYEDTSIQDVFKTKIEWFIYREPMEHLVSALHTEILNKDISDLSIPDVISKFVREQGTTHWGKDILKNVYELWNRFNKNKFNVVNLKNLSNLLIELGYEIPNFDYEDFQFKHLDNWVSKEDIVLMVQKDFPIEWAYLMSIVESEKEYYHKLDNKIRTPLKYV